MSYPERYTLMRRGQHLPIFDAYPRYRIMLRNKWAIYGISNAQGETSLVMSASLQIAQVALLRQDGTILSSHQPALTRDAQATFDSSRSDAA